MEQSGVSGSHREECLWYDALRWWANQIGWCLPGTTTIMLRYYPISSTWFHRIIIICASPLKEMTKLIHFCLKTVWLHLASNLMRILLTRFGRACGRAGGHVSLIGATICMLNNFTFVWPFAAGKGRLLTGPTLSVKFVQFPYCFVFQGDSGGPLMMSMVDDRWAAIGVVSWGIRCGEPTKPGLYTRTSKLSFLTNQFSFERRNIKFHPWHCRSLHGLDPIDRPANLIHSIAAKEMHENNTKLSNVGIYTDDNEHKFIRHIYLTWLIPPLAPTVNQKQIICKQNKNIFQLS